jgi:hypothetical protein
MKDKIKEIATHLPHVKTVWVLNDEVFIHAVKGGVKMDIEEDELIKPTKKEKNGTK